MRVVFSFKGITLKGIIITGWVMISYKPLKKKELSFYGMIDEKNFKKVKDSFDSFENEREGLIRTSRELSG